MQKSILLLVLLLAMQIAGAQSIYVDVSNTSGIEDGTIDHPYNTIDEALSIAQNGDNISIAAGNYPEDSLLIRTNVDISGENQSSTIVEGSFIFSGGLDIIPLSISNLCCRNVILSDSSILKTRVDILNCRLQTFTNDISVFDTTASMHFSGNTLNDSIHLLVALCKGDININNCSSSGQLSLSFASIREGRISINDNVVGGDMKILSYLKKDTLFVSNNEIEACLEITSGSSFPDIITNNTIGSDIVLSSKSSTGIQFRNNEVEDGSLYARFTALSNSDITNNNFQNGGIDFTAVSAVVSIEGNTINSNELQCGINMATSSGGIVKNNVISLPYIVPSGLPFEEDTNAVCGIKARAISFDGMWGNEISGGSYGVYLNSVSMGRCSQNSIRNAHYGLYAASVSANIDSNIVEQCTGSGMVLDTAKEWDTSGVSLSHNTVRNNGGHGIWAMNNFCMGRSEQPGSGYNVLKNNAAFDLYIETPADLIDTLWAQNNEWSHVNENDIGLYDVYDANDDPSRAVVMYYPVLPFGISDLDLARNINIYPNPGCSEIFLAGEIFGIERIEIIDMKGKLFLKNEIAGDCCYGDAGIRFDVDKLPAGMYLIRIIIDKKIIVKRLIKYGS